MLCFIYCLLAEPKPSPSVPIPSAAAYGPLRSQGRRVDRFSPFPMVVGCAIAHGALGPRRELLRRLLLHRWFGAGHRGAAHVAGLRLVVAADAVHGLAIVPHHEVMQRPFVDVDELRLRRVL